MRSEYGKLLDYAMSDRLDLIVSEHLAHRAGLEENYERSTSAQALGVPEDEVTVESAQARFEKYVCLIERRINKKLRKDPRSQY